MIDVVKGPLIYLSLLTFVKVFFVVLDLVQQNNQYFIWIWKFIIIKGVLLNISLSIPSIIAIYKIKN